MRRLILAQMNASENSGTNAGAQFTAPASLLDLLPARRSVLESPEIMGLVLEYCNGETLRQMSMVNRFFDAASAQKLYRKVNLDASGWYLKDGRNRVITELQHRDRPSICRTLEHWLSHPRSAPRRSTTI